ncbi:glycoside hydrolase family 16 protein [Kribbella italica]|uniref:GH16 domain-containing protein n=1 Tax=Kribbella italica TaxID=1540520 RepID=A0A7W9JCA7_9ACTN|nr:glycoside hydrolase family 16 protein [Kribbella italica]MBB5839498.1 hypothetical protein [Kribbella italica]
MQLDTSVWSPYYLPHWSSRAASAASYEQVGSDLRLFIPPEQGLWCADDHQPPLRVSGIQSGNYSGPVGSTVGQQPFRDGQLVREEQEPFWGWTPTAPARIELRARADLSPRSMVSLWMVGLEDQPERCAEICVMEVFGNALEPGSTAVGCGLHSFRDPSVPDDFTTVRLPIDVAEFHTYAVEWTAEQAEFYVDDQPVRRCAGPPAYPMQLMLAVFDFPEWSDHQHVPSFTVDYVR